MTDQGPCPTCGRYENRPVTVDAVVVRDGKVLLIQRARDPYRGYFALPGGFVDVDEDTKTACLRELTEETELRGTVERLLGVYDAPERDPRQHTVAIAYLVRVELDAEPQAGDDAGQVGWFDLDALPPLAFDHARVLKDLES